MKNLKKQSKGITLIALVITIIILIILTGVTLNSIVGKDGLFNKAKDVAKEHEKATIKEELQLAILDIQTTKGKDFKREDLNDLSNIGAIVKSVDIPAKGEYKDYLFEVDKDYVVTIFEKEVEAPKIVVKEITMEGFTIEINEDYNSEDIDEFIYYVDGKVVFKGTKDKKYKVTGLRGDKEYTNIYVVAMSKNKNKKSNVCSAHIDEAWNVLEEIRSKESNLEENGFSLVEKSSQNEYFNFDILRAGNHVGVSNWYACFKWVPEPRIQGARRVDVTFKLLAERLSGTTANRSDIFGIVTIHYSDGTTSEKETGRLTTCIAGVDNWIYEYPVMSIETNFKNISYIEFYLRWKGCRLYWITW